MTSTSQQASSTSFDHNSTNSSTPLLHQQPPPTPHHQHHPPSHHYQHQSTNPTMMLSRAKHQRKSESDVQIDGVHVAAATATAAAGNRPSTAGVLLNEPQIGLLNKNYFLSSNNQQQQQQTANIQQTAKNYPFSPNLPVKPTKSNLIEKIYFVLNFSKYFHETISLVTQKMVFIEEEKKTNILLLI